MKFLPTSGFLAACSLAALFSAASESAHAQYSYTITDLGPVSGDGSNAAAINDSGMVTGTEDVAPGQNNAFIYSNGVLTGLGTLGGTQSQGFAINSAGVVVGQSTPLGTGANVAFIDTNGVMSSLGTLGGSTSEANGINSSGVVVGQSYDSSYNAYAFIDSNGVMTSLGTLSGTFSIANGINDSGTVVGQSSSSSGYKVAFIDSSGVMSSLGTLGGNTSTANGINASGIVVGYSTLSDGTTQAFTDVGGVMTGLGTLGGSASYGNAINGSGVVVGQSYTYLTYNPTAFVDSNGTMLNLNTISDLSGSDFDTLISATGINSSGDIVGYGETASGNSDAFLLTPTVSAVPEPAVCAVWGALGLAALAGWRVKRRFARDSLSAAIVPA